MQQKSIPELFVGFFKMIFYAFYYSGYGVSVVLGWASRIILSTFFFSTFNFCICRYFLHVLMSLMRGPQIEEPVVVKEELEKVGHIRVLPALPAASDEQNTQIQAFGVDITKEDNGQ